MARVSPLLGRLNAGELSPRLEGRPDLEFQQAGFRTLENMIPLVQGPTTRRPGTRFIKELKSSSNQTTLVPFIFSTSQAYMLEFGGQYIRFYRDKGRLDVANTDGAIANGTFPAGIASWTSRSTGGGSISHDATNQRMNLVPGGTASTDIGWAEQAVTIGAGFTSVEHVLAFRVLGARGDYVQLRIGTTSTGAELIADKVCAVGWHIVAFTPGATTFYVQFRNQPTANNLITSQNKTIQIDDVSLLDNVPLELTTPYAQGDLFYSSSDNFNPYKLKVKFTQSADVVYFWHPTYEEMKLSRSGDTSWSLTEVQHKDGPYLEENTTATTLTPSAATGTGVTMTASSTTGINDGQGFKTTDVGRLIRYKNGANAWGWCIITAWTSTTVVTVDILSTFTAAAAVTTWRLGLWSDTTGFPACGTFHEERLFRGGGTTVRPQRFDGSHTGDFDNFGPGTAAADEAISYNIGSNDVAAILWMASLRNLLIGTPSGPFSVATDTTNAALTPTNAKVLRQTSDGCSDMGPAVVGAVLLYGQRQDRKLRELAYTIESEGYRAPDMNARADHIFAPTKRLISMAYQAEPFSVLWGIRSDGMLVGFTYERDQEVLAWHRHPVGGTSVSVEAIAVIPGDEGDELWMIVKRTINSATKRYVEVMESPLESDDAQVDAWYVDSGLQYSGPATSSLTGLSHLEGQTVKIWSNKGVHPDEVVSSGAVSLDFQVTQAQVGLAYTWKMKTQRLEAGARAGTAQTKKKRIARVSVRLLRSLGVRVGRDDTNYDTISPRTGEDNIGQAPTLISGDRENPFTGTWDTDGGVQLFGNSPTPVTVVAIVPVIATNEG